MVRFIFICMGVVALSVVSIVAQNVTSDISTIQTQLAERNDAAPEDTVVAIAPAEPADEFFSPDQLNAIDTAAGGEDTGFGESFTDEAPKALADGPVPPFSAIEPSAQ